MFSFFRKKPPRLPAIRNINADHAADCARIHATSFAHPWGGTEFARLLTENGVTAQGAFDAGGRKLQGFILSRLVLDEAEILTIVVDPAARRAGLGQALLASNIAELTRRSAAWLFLEVDEDNVAARGLYARFGFIQVGERKAYYGKADGTRGAALILRRDL
jgi:ribosomal-protein-alanine N-acetyltransferase